MPPHYLTNIFNRQPREIGKQIQAGANLLVLDLLLIGLSIVQSVSIPICLTFLHSVPLLAAQPRGVQVSYSSEAFLAEVREAILIRTSRRVWNLSVEFSSQEIILRGFADCYHMKQLAQEGIRKIFPEVRVKNAITVLN